MIYATRKEAEKVLYAERKKGRDVALLRTLEGFRVIIRPSAR